MPLVDELANAIAVQEGFFLAGTRATRNNNPGNLRAAAGSNPKDAGGFVVFRSAEEGWAALRRQIGLDADRGLSLGEFIAKFAPPFENDTAGYTRNVATRLGVSAHSLLTDLVDSTGWAGSGEALEPQFVSESDQAGWPRWIAVVGGLALIYYLVVE